MWKLSSGWVFEHSHRARTHIWLSHKAIPLLECHFWNVQVDPCPPRGVRVRGGNALLARHTQAFTSPGPRQAVLRSPQLLHELPIGGQGVRLQDHGPALSPPPEEPAPGRAPHRPTSAHKASDHTVTRAHGRLHLTFGIIIYSPSLQTLHEHHARPTPPLPPRLPCPPHLLPQLPEPGSQVGAGFKVEGLDTAVPVPGPPEPGLRGFPLIWKSRQASARLGPPPQLERTCPGQHTPLGQLREAARAERGQGERRARVCA